MQRRAFTLFEVLAAVAIVAMLSSLALISLRAAVARASFEEVVKQVISHDRGVRLQAQTLGLAQVLRIDMESLVSSSANAGTGAMPQTTLHLPPGYNLDSVRTMASGSIVEVSPAGHSRSYAVHLVGPRRRAWVVVEGLTGEAEVMDEFELNKIWRVMESGRGLPPLNSVEELEGDTST